MSAQRTTTSGRQRRRGPSRGDLLKDGLSFIGAWGIIAHQTLVAKSPNWLLLLVALALLGVPGTRETLVRIFGTRSSNSSSPSPDSVPSSRSTSGDDQ